MLQWLVLHEVIVKSENANCSQNKSRHRSLPLAAAPTLTPLIGRQSSIQFDKKKKFYTLTLEAHRHRLATPALAVIILMFESRDGQCLAYKTINL